MRQSYLLAQCGGMQNDFPLYAVERIDMQTIKSMRAWASCAAVALLCACASYSGSGLVPGQSTAAQVEALMGVPSDKLTAANGDAIWQFPRGPYGRQTYAVRFGGDGVMKEIRQVLTEENFAKIVPGSSNKEQVRMLLGRPRKVTVFANLQREVWDYGYGDPGRPMVLAVQFSIDGVVRETLMLADTGIEFSRFRGGR
jgi:hypothetical protein